MGFPARFLQIREERIVFQSLVGVYGFSRHRLPLHRRLYGASYKRFQSLVGVYGFSRSKSSHKIRRLFRVSIPSRGLWVFPRNCLLAICMCPAFQSLVGVYGFSRVSGFRTKVIINSVSIPSRGLWVFPRKENGFYNRKYQVSIPSRGLWVFPL